MKKSLHTLVLSMIPILLAGLAKADTALDLEIIRSQSPGGFTSYFAFPRFTATNPVPTTCYRIESPTAKFKWSFGTNTTGSASSFVTLQGVLDECTNGMWTVTTDKDLPSENTYTFTMTISGLDTSLLGPVNILSPADGATGVANNPSYTWTGPSGFDSVVVRAYEPDFNPFYSATLPSNATSWVTGPMLADGTNTFEVRYEIASFSGVMTTVPMDGGAQPLPGWTSGARVRTSAQSTFEVGQAGTPLQQAVDNFNLVFTTGGAIDWFSQTDESNDGVDAAQSGPIDHDEESWIETTVNGPGTLTFWVKVSSDDSYGFDYLEIFVDDDIEDEISGESDWQYYEIEIFNQGPICIRWTYFKDFDVSGGDDAAWLDQVSFEPIIDVSMTLSIWRELDSGEEQFFAFPNLDFVCPFPVTEHAIESPNELFSGSTSSGSAVIMDSLQEVIDEMEAGNWTLYINRGDPSELQYTFTATVTSLVTNDIPLTTILSPADGTTGVSTNPVFQWTGPGSFSSQFVSVNNLGGGAGGNETLPVAATTWTNAPTLDMGTNRFRVTYTLNNFAGILYSEPVNAPTNTLSSWFPSTSLRSAAESEFVVSLEAAEGIDIVNPRLSGTDFVFSLNGSTSETYVVECLTNLVTDAWTVVTNIPGTGALQDVVLPLGTAHEAFYRIETQ
jgi:hypothetical protein